MIANHASSFSTNKNAPPPPSMGIVTIRRRTDRQQHRFANHRQPISMHQCQQIGNGISCSINPWGDTRRSIALGIEQLPATVPKTCARAKPPCVLYRHCSRSFARPPAPAATALATILGLSACAHNNTGHYIRLRGTPGWQLR